ncbi:hypothetical protein [Martelella sp. FOR1707]
MTSSLLNTVAAIPQQTQMETIMNRVSKTAMAAIIASLAFVGTSKAEDSITMDWPANIDQTLATFDQDFNVKYVADRKDQEELPGDFLLPAGSVENIQAAIMSNEPLLMRLQEQGVNVNDVVSAEQAADGSITFWLR